ncbi:MAG: hypothetical protein IJF38_05520 [Clostridia bacterium]|nr:hypothetical protein [Clostridia bacterium]
MSGARRLLYIMRGFLCVIIALVISKLAYLNLIWISTPFDSVFRQLPEWAMKLVCALAFLLVYNSLVHFLTLYDREQRDNFLSQKREIEFPRELLHIIKSPVFILETASALFTVNVLSLLGAISEIVGVFYIDTEPSRLVEIILPLAIFLPLFFLFSLFTRYDLRRYFIRLAITDSLSVLESKFKMALRIFAIFLLYPTVFPYAPLLVYVAFTFVNIFVSLSALLTALGLILAIVFLIALTVFIAYLRAIRARLRFVKRLAHIARERGFELSEVRHPVSSFFRPHEGVSFTLTRGNERFDCRFLSCVWRGAPLYFTSDRHAYILHRLGTKNHHISLNHNLNWHFTSEGVKIVLVSTLPKRTLAIAQNGSTRPLTPGDKIWDAVLYDPDSMLAAIDRDCLGRTN